MIFVLSFRPCFHGFKLKGSSNSLTIEKHTTSAKHEEYFILNMKTCISGIFPLFFSLSYLAVNYINPKISFFFFLSEVFHCVLFGAKFCVLVQHNLS